MPENRGRLHLYSDTSNFTTGSAPRLIAYASKRMLTEAKKYSLTELGLCGLGIDIASFLIC